MPAGTRRECLSHEHLYDMNPEMKKVYRWGLPPYVDNRNPAFESQGQYLRRNNLLFENEDSFSETTEEVMSNDRQKIIELLQLLNYREDEITSAVKEFFRDDFLQNVLNNDNDRKF